MVRSFSGVSSIGGAETFVLKKILTNAFYQPCSQGFSQPRRKRAGRKALRMRYGLSSQIIAIHLELMSPRTANIHQLYCRLQEPTMIVL